MLYKIRFLNKSVKSCSIALIDIAIIVLVQLYWFLHVP